MIAYIAKCAFFGAVAGASFSDAREELRKPDAQRNYTNLTIRTVIGIGAAALAVATIANELSTPHNE